MIQDLMTKLKGLEDREADWENRIAVQEDTIQILSSKVEELKGKMCRCQNSPHISQGSGRAESPYELEGEQPEASSSSDDDRLWPIQGGSRRGEMATPEAKVDPNDVGPSVPVFTSRVFSDDVVIEGPYLPESTSNTLVEIPNDLPELEDAIPIMVPPARLQRAVRSGGRPKSSYHSPSCSPSPVYSHRAGSVRYHPYSSLIPAEEECVRNTWGSCQCLSCRSPGSTGGGAGSGSSTGS